MSMTSFKLAIAATGVVALLWSLPALLVEAGCSSCAAPGDLPVPKGALVIRRIR